MTWASDLASGIDDIYRVFAVSATYTDRVAATQTVSAIVSLDLQQFGSVADVSGKTAAISVRVSDMALPPRRGETYTIGAKVYTVDSIITADELEHTALVA